jgi:hypothetical protein
MRWRRPAAIVKDRPILSSERTLYIRTEHRSSIEEKKMLAESVKALDAKTN